jgi:membrane-bound lytic murein transglycosylase MltF
MVVLQDRGAGRMGWMRIIALVLALAACAGQFWPAQARAEMAATAAKAPRLRALPVDSKPWTGDFEAMAQRRMIRVLVPYSRSLYFADRGHERGLTAELVRDFERHINRKLRTGKRPITVYIVPTTRDRLLTGLVDGLGDIAAGNLTVTGAREAVADFAGAGAAGRVNEILVTGPRAPAVAGIDGLSGQRVHVRPSSSYRESLAALSDRFAAQGRAPVDIVEVSDALEDEDMMEMVNAGLLGAIVVDDWKARLWARVLPKLRLHADVVLRADALTGWAIRKDSPQLAAAIDGFFGDPKAVRETTAARLAAYHRRMRQLRDPTAEQEFRRFEATLSLFDTYGTRYGFEPLLLQAQGFQESRLDQGARSAHGAIGVMQVMPATGEAMRVGDIARVEANIHAGAKYMDQLVSRHFADAQFSEANRALFAFAAYNAGPARIARMRELARKRGLDPDKWFNNVEIVVAEKVGAEPTHYVRNIYKYYVTYKLIAEAEAALRGARRQAAGE